MFPAPLEVDRFLYAEIKSDSTRSLCFRPLSRWIGSYTDERFKKPWDKTKFPAPLEVDRYLYLIIRRTKNPFEQFPAPRKVDRFLYQRMMFSMIQAIQRFRPLSR